MPEAIAQQLACAACAAEVRAGTVFCYNCGASLIGSRPDGPHESVSEPELAIPLSKVERDSTGGRRTKAATERKISRGTPRMAKEFKWEPVEDSSWSTILISVVIFAISATVVMLVVIWR
ncbi:MAG: hypothetical protein WKF34_12230 [Pyrinomonadaceae bacterium]